MSSGPSDAVLALARDGDRDAVSAVLTHLHPLLARQLGFMFGFHPRTEDALQESLVAILQALPKFRGDARLETWATAIALRTARRQLEKDRREVPGELPERLYEVDFEGRIELARLSAALAKLKPKKREAFILMELFGYTAQEAGRALGTFANTAASRCRHARAELDALLTNPGGKPHQGVHDEPDADGAAVPAEVDGG